MLRPRVLLLTTPLPLSSPWPLVNTLYGGLSSRKGRTCRTQLNPQSPFSRRTQRALLAVWNIPPLLHHSTFEGSGNSPAAAPVARGPSSPSSPSPRSGSICRVAGGEMKGSFRAPRAGGGPPSPPRRSMGFCRKLLSAPRNRPGCPRRGPVRCGPRRAYHFTSTGFRTRLPLAPPKRSFQILRKSGPSSFLGR